MFLSVPLPSVPSCTNTDPKQGKLEKDFHVLQKGNVSVATKAQRPTGHKRAMPARENRGNILELGYVICQPSYKHAGRCMLNYYLYTSSSENRNVFQKHLHVPKSLCPPFFLPAAWLLWHRRSLVRLLIFQENLAAD